MIKIEFIYFILLILSACTIMPKKVNKNNSISMIKKISTIKDIKPVINKARHDTLVIFDVDWVILSSADMLGRPKSREIISPIFKKNRELFGKEYNEKLVSRFHNQIELELVEPQIKDIINDLANQNIPYIALTKMGAGKYGEINNALDWRYAQLKKHNVYFSWDKVQQKYLWNINSGFEHGIVHAGTISKGEALKHVLDIAQFKPKQIIFVDDILENIKSVEQFSLENGIKFFGFHYQAQVFEKDIKPKACLLEWQIEILKNNGIWVSDKEALKQIPNCSEN